MIQWHDRGFFDSAQTYSLGRRMPAGAPACTPWS